MRRALLLLLAVATPLACHNTSADTESPTKNAASAGVTVAAPGTKVAATAAAAADPQAARLPPPAPACEAIPADAYALPPLDTKVVTAALGPIVDASGDMNRFYERLARLVRGEAKDHVRIGVYGDSNMTMDFITGAMRRMFQEKLGDGGHGFVALARPWPWYRHMDVKMELDEKRWRKIATSTNHVRDGEYGMANIAADSSTPGAWSWVATAGDSQPIGKAVSSVDVFYMKRPNGGAFAIKVDGKKVKDVVAASTETTAAFEHLDVPDGPHKIECVVESGDVRMFGASLERATPSIIVDSLGTGALNYEQMRHVTAASRDPMLERRKYDLIVFLIGTNLFAPAYHEKWMSTVIDGMEKAVPGTPILVLSPPDIELHQSDKHSDPRIVKLSRQLADIAGRHHWAFWDFRAAMGGDDSMLRFARKGLANWDLVHLTKGGGAIMGRRLGHALFEGFAGYLKEHPDAGCKAPVAAGDAQQPQAAK